MRKKILISLLLCFIFACSKGSDDPPNAIPPTLPPAPVTGEFELVGQWKGTNLMIPTPYGDMPGDMVMQYSDSTYLNQASISTILGLQSYTTRGTMVRYDNLQNFCITKVVSTDVDNQWVGKFSKTTYVLSADGLSCTATQYSYEISDTAAENSTLILMDNIHMVKQ